VLFLRAVEGRPYGLALSNQLGMCPRRRRCKKKQEEQYRRDMNLHETLFSSAQKEEE